MRRLIVLRGLVLGVLGIGVGLGLAFFLTRMMQSLLTDVETTDPVVFGAAGGLLLTVAIAAVPVPALQASRTDPMVVLRSE